MKGIYMKIHKICGIISAMLVVVVGFTTLGIKLYNTEKNLNNTIVTLESKLESTQNELNKTKESLDNEIKKSTQLNNEIDKLTQELNSAEEKIAYLDKHIDTHNGWAMCWRDVNLNQEEIDFFAKLLYCEAGIMGHEGQFWTASAILNLSHNKQMSIWDMGHNINLFEVAPWVDEANPTQQQYDIIYEVLNNGWIADVSYFRTDYPHSFGNFMIKIENVCFNSP
jgi:hypothetical protein